MYIINMTDLFKYKTNQKLYYFITNGKFSRNKIYVHVKLFPNEKQILDFFLYDDHTVIIFQILTKKFNYYEKFSQSINYILNVLFCQFL